MFDDGVAPPEDPGTQAPGLGEAPCADATAAPEPPAEGAPQDEPSPGQDEVSEVPVPGHPGNLDNAALIDSIVEYGRITAMAQAAQYRALAE
ncbi:MAG: hypothetical protein AB7F42_24705, partial [Mycolicibacterium sp.]